MSFRGDGSRRYGHVPPAQYPVANPAADQYLERRPSFNAGDDTNHSDHSVYPQSQMAHQANANRMAENELFPSGSPQGPNSGPGYGSEHNISSSIVMAGYQHHYQGLPSLPVTSVYNPQNFVRTQSQSQAHSYHSAPVLRFARPASPTYASTPNTSHFIPQVYNPAAYVNTNTATSPPGGMPSRHSTVSGGGYGVGYGSPTYGNYASSQVSSSTSPTGGYAPSLPSPGYSTATTPSHPAAQQFESPHCSSYGGNTYYGNHGVNSTSGHMPTPLSQAPYPVVNAMPVGPMPIGPNYSATNSYGVRPSRSNSLVSQASSNAGYTPSIGLARHPTNAPLPSRPMEDVPEESDWQRERVTQDDLMNDIVSDLGMGRSGSGATHSSLHRLQRINGNMCDEDLNRLRRFNSIATIVDDPRYDQETTPLNILSQCDATKRLEFDEDDESDPEGAAGLLAMEEDYNDRRFSSIPLPGGLQLAQQSPAPHLHPPAEERTGKENAYGDMDLGLYGGSHNGAMGSSLQCNGSRPYMRSQGSDGTAVDSAGGQPYPKVAVDYGATGGLQLPESDRLSFDEGDEQVYVNSGSNSPSKDDYPDMFYHPGISNRPLPPVPPGDEASRDPLLVQAVSVRGQYQHGHSSSLSSPRPTPEIPPGIGQQHVERSISLSSHSNTPQVQAPARSRTDAAEERKRAHRQLGQQQQQLHHQHVQQTGGTSSPYDEYDAATPASIGTYDVITLPTGRKRKFNPSKLTVADVKRCAEPWALSAVTTWVREMTEDEQYLTRKTIEEGIVNLFCAKVPTMNVADAEFLGATLVESMFAAGILAPDEDEWIKFESGHMSGVLWQLTGSGCYAPKLHEDERVAPRLQENGIPVRCYSQHCGRTLKKVNLDGMLSEESEAGPASTSVSWHVFHNLTTEQQQLARGKKENTRQNVLHEIVTTEEEFMGQLDVVQKLYRDQLRAWQPPIIAANRLDKFMDAVFGKFEAVHETNMEHLLSPLKYRQQEQGPWISGFSDIFREWIRKARPAYIDFCSDYPYGTYLMRKEADRNMLFRQFLEMVREHKKSRRLEWTTFLRAPIARLQRYSLLLETVRKATVVGDVANGGGSDDVANLERAIEEIKSVTHECDEKVADMTKKVDLLELQSMLVLRPGFQSVLHLDHLGRELIKQGELQRQGSNRMRWVDTHALLFDHYFILAKLISPKDGRGEKKYDVSKEPIPMPLLFLESMNDDPVTKQKGITGVARTTHTVGAFSTQLNKLSTSSVGVDRPGLEHHGTSSSLTTVTRLTPVASNDESRIIYPFRIKHLGHELYTLYASSQADRLSWCNAIIEAKTRHALALHAQNAEPFRLRVLSDCGFAYDTITAIGRPAGVSIHGTPLDRAIREMEEVFGTGRGPPPVCRAAVNCATAFTAHSKSVIAIGTDCGVYISEATDPRGWQRTISATRVAQMAVLEEFSVCLLIADKNLISYPLETVAPSAGFSDSSSSLNSSDSNARHAPVRLAKDVGFFATARMKDRMLLFYKRKEGMHNIFKVLEPVFQKSAERKPRLFGGRSKTSASGGTDSFRDFDEFYLPTECYSLNLFHTYMAVASAKGFELLTLDKKIPQSIPHNLNLPAIANIASRIRDQRPLGMFKLNDQEFLLTYEDCAVYVDKHGEVSRTLIMEYSGKLKKAKGATMYGQYLLLFNENYVEVRNAENGRLRQIIAGRDVRCLDYGYRGPTGGVTSAPGGGPQSVEGKGTVKICMSHPEVAGVQIVLEMLLNDGHSEKTV